MSADTFIAYCGLRFEVPSDEIEGVEARTDARILAARKSGIKYYYGSFGGDQEDYLLFVGFPIGIFGVENKLESSFAMIELQEIFNKTQLKLNEAGLEGKAAFYFQLQPDF